MKMIIITILCSLTIMFSAYSQETNNVSDTNNVSIKKLSVDKIVSDIIMMKTNNVSPDIIRVYVVNLDFVSYVSPSNIVSMTKKGIDTDIIQLLIDKNIETRRFIEKILENTDKKNCGESYDYFDKNYLKPRAEYLLKKFYDTEAF